MCDGGKWHLGFTPQFLPEPAGGFDEFMGTPISHDYGCTDVTEPKTLSHPLLPNTVMVVSFLAIACLH